MFKGMRLRFRARWLFAVDTILLLLTVRAEAEAATMTQLGEYARDGAR